jgi:hypothetical protein
LFGAERCNFESNFPVDKMGSGYATLWNAFKRITAGCSQTEKLALYSGTAKRLYRPRSSQHSRLGARLRRSSAVSTLRFGHLSRRLKL